MGGRGKTGAKDKCLLQGRQASLVLNNIDRDTIEFDHQGPSRDTEFSGPSANTNCACEPYDGCLIAPRMTILSAFADDDVVPIQQGQSFIDAAHLVHTVSRNASESDPVLFVLAYTVKQGEPVTVTSE